ncbi:MAG: alpha/beta fold hydrolase [Promethearchaeota archaeon]
MSRNRRKLLAIISIYCGLMLPAILLANHGTSLASEYYAGYNLKTHSIRTFDGFKFDFMTVMNENISSEGDGSVPAVVAFHGLGNSKEKALTRAIHFARNGYAVFIPDLRGMGSHEGFIRLDVEWRDVRQMLDFIGNSSLYRKVNMSNIGTWGHSNGGFQSLMTAIHDPRVKASVCSSGAYNTTELLEHMDSRLFLVGFSWDPADEDEVRKRSPIEMVNETNPRNILLFHGTADTNVPFIHSQQLNATINPHGNRTDYEFVVYEGADHNIANTTSLRKSISWFDLYLRNVTTAPSTVPLFEEPFSRSKIEQVFESILWLTVAGFMPLVYLLEMVVGKVWNSIIEKKKTRGHGKENLLVNTSHVKNIKQSLEPRLDPEHGLTGTLKKSSIITLLVGWSSIHLVSGLCFINSMLSRVITSIGVPLGATLLFAFVHDLVKKRRGKIHGERILHTSAMATSMVSGGFGRDFVVAVATVIPAWLIQLQILNGMSQGSTVHVAGIGALLESNPDNPLSIGILFMYLVFMVGMYAFTILFRSSFATMTRGVFDNITGTLERGKGVKRFFSWFWLMIQYSLLVGVFLIAGNALFTLFMVNPPLTDVDFTLSFNVALMLVIGVIGAVSLVIQQVLEKLMQSYNKSVLVTTLILLSLFINVAPRPF